MGMTGDLERWLTADQDMAYRRLAAVAGMDPGDPGVRVYPADVEVFAESDPMMPDAVPVVPRWWVTTDPATIKRFTFLPDYAPFEGDMVVVGMRAAWDGGDIPLSCDPADGLYFRKGRTADGTMYGRVFAPAPPPVGLWSGEWPDADR